MTGSYQQASGDVAVDFDMTPLLNAAITFIKNNGITTQSQLDTAINNMTAGGAAELAVTKALARCIRIVTPVP